MDLLKYLEPMKNMPERFSNLAFWRGVRKLRDVVVSAFEYVDSWGESVENKEKELEDLINSKSGFSLLKVINLTIDMFNFNPINNTYFIEMRTPPNIPNIPENCKVVIIYCDVQLKVGDTSTYEFQFVWSSPVDNSRVVFPQNIIPCNRIITVDAQPRFHIVQSSCWCYG